ncbi:MAG: hypothetical protein Q4D05_08460 [Acinetobacter sp.]|nr:hypothetical protein [Acinetobacter sp.]
MMETKYNPDIHRRKSLRLAHYDYSQQGMYFITICCHNRECLFGKIENGEVQLNELGKKAWQCWQDIPKFYPQVKLHDFVVMPNHIHGIIEITHQIQTQCDTQKQVIRGTSQTIGAMVRGFKAGVTSWARQHTSYDVIWQRNYYEHIIRNEQSYLYVVEYIRNNPLSWEEAQFWEM